MKSLFTSTKIYLGLVAILILVRVLFLAFPATVALPPQAGQVNWLFIIVIGLLGIIGLNLSRKVGFPEMWESSISNKQRLLIPAFIGSAFGLITIVEYLFHPSERTLFPLFVVAPLFIYGAIVVEVFLRLFLLSFLVWVSSFVFKGQKGRVIVFWIIAALVALFEPVLFLADEGSVGVTGFVVMLRLFVANLIAAFLFRRYGFTAPLTMRFCDYLLWHIIWQG